MYLFTLAPWRHRTYTHCAHQGMLVYELMKGGSLESRLLGPVSSGDGALDILPLPWQQRLHIAAQVASGLLYTHDTAGGIGHM